VKIELDKRFVKKLEGRFGKYSFEVGVLDDGPYLEPKRGERGLKGADVISQYAGGPVRQKTRRDSGQTISDVSRENRARLGVNYLAEPFKGKGKNSDLMRFTKEFFKLAFGRSEKKRCENMLQAIVRNPILRGEYGRNSETTKKIKGFERPMIDTAQLFRALKAICRTRSK
jgi:hypothetical protein